MKRYFPKTAAAWTAATTELHRWNNSRAIVCRQCGTIRRIRRGLATLAAVDHELGTGHTVKVKRFG